MLGNQGHAANLIGSRMHLALPCSLSASADGSDVHLVQILCQAELLKVAKRQRSCGQVPVQASPGARRLQLRRGFDESLKTSVKCIASERLGRRSKWSGQEWILKFEESLPALPSQHLRSFTHQRTCCMPQNTCTRRSSIRFLL